jgi:hypothetical protein
MNAADNLLSLHRFLLIFIRIVDNKFSGIAYHRYRQMFSGGFFVYFKRPINFSQITAFGSNTHLI